MKTRNLILTIGAVALTAITFNATAADALLSPRATGNQIKTAAATASDVNLVGANANLTISPRALGNQIKTVAGTDNSVNPALACARNMIASPRAIQACLESGTMAGCKTTTVAPLK